MASIILVLFAVLCAVIGAGLSWRSYVLSRKLKLRFGNEGEDLASEILDGIMALDRLDDITLGTGRLKSSAQIDHLIRGDGRIIVLETKNWGGKFSGTAEDTHWMTIHKDGVAKYRRNPLHQAGRQSEFVRKLFPGANVVHAVLMVGSGFHETQFPQGVFRRYQQIALKEFIETPGTDEERKRTKEVWDKIVSHAYEPNHEKRQQRYTAAVEHKFMERPWAYWLFLAASLSCLSFAIGYATHAINLQSIPNFHG